MKITLPIQIGKEHMRCDGKVITDVFPQLLPEGQKVEPEDKTPVSTLGIKNSMKAKAQIFAKAILNLPIPVLSELDNVPFENSQPLSKIELSKLFEKIYEGHWDFTRALIKHDSDSPARCKCT